MRIRKRRQSYWNHYRHTLDHIHYARERNYLRKFTRNLQRDYEVHLTNCVKRSSKAFWHYVNFKLPSVGSLKLVEGGEAATDQEKANTLNSYFSSAFTNEYTCNW